MSSDYRYFFLLGSIMGAVMVEIYKLFGVNMEDTFGMLLMGVAILMLLFVFYRNKLQFSGFYKGKGNVKLSKGTSTFLVTCSLLLLGVAPFFISR
ncbi:MAG: hypothetical protein ACI35O_10425 [Bacillaceae bacterium]